MVSGRKKIKKDKDKDKKSSSGKSKSKSKSKRKKKGDITPWSKKERLLVFWVFAGTILASAILGLSARSWKLPNLPRIKIPSFEGETIVIEGDSEAQKKAEEATTLFRRKVRPLSGVYTLYVARLEDGSNYGVNEMEVFPAASLNKLPVMLTIYVEAERGNIDLEETYTLKESDKISGSGSLYSEPEGTQVSYRELVRYMGKESDNTAFGIARNILGDEKIISVMNEIGIPETLLTENETTAYDVGLFFEKLWNSEIINVEARDEILEYMTETTYEDWIVKGLPGVRVSHKFGTLPHIRNDAGIVFANGEPFVLVILSKGVIETEADEVIPEIARMVYQVELGEY